MEAAPVEDPLEQEEVRAAGAELDVRRTDDRPAIEVGCDLGIVHLRKRGDLLRLEEASDPAQVQLQDRRGSGREDAGELVLRRQPLACRDRDRRGTRDAGHLLGQLRRRRLLEPERGERLEPLREPDRARRRELPVRAEEEVTPVPDGLAYGADVVLAAVELVEAGLAWVEGRVVPRRVELERREPPFRVPCCPLGGEGGVEVDVGRVAGLPVEIGVRTQPVVHAPAEELVDGLVDRLADDVPAGHLDPAEDADQRDVRSARVALPVDITPEPLDVERIGPDHVTRADVLDHAGDDVWPERRGVDLPDPLDPVVGDELEEDEVAPAEVGWRVADDERLETGDLHGLLPPSVVRTRSRCESPSRRPRRRARR